MIYEWDLTKVELNRRQHGVDFDEAASVFEDRLSLTAFDPDHSFEEDRYLSMGLSEKGRLLIISHTERGSVIHIISARIATRRERKEYEDGQFP
jgi:uncharacterized DUF497 family protein